MHMTLTQMEVRRTNSFCPLKPCLGKGLASWRRGSTTVVFAANLQCFFVFQSKCLSCHNVWAVCWWGWRRCILEIVSQMSILILNRALDCCHGSDSGLFFGPNYCSNTDTVYRENSVWKKNGWFFVKWILLFTLCNPAPLLLLVQTHTVCVSYSG